MSPQTRKRFLLILPLCLIPAIILVRVFYLHRTNPGGYQSNTKQRLTKVVTSGTPSELAPWQDGQFIEVNSPDIPRFVSEVMERDAKALSADQRNRLLALITQFFQAYYTGRFEDYFAFKTRGTGYSLDFTGKAEQMMKALAKTSALDLPAEPKAKLERIWELVTVADANNGIGPRLLKLEPSTIRILISTKKTAESGVQQYAQKVSTMYPGFAPNYLVKYDKMPEAVIKSERYLVVALLEINGRYSTSDTASPMFVAFYWSSETNRWYPWELAKYRAAKFFVLF